MSGLESVSQVGVGLRHAVWKKVETDGLVGTSNAHSWVNDD